VGELIRAARGVTGFAGVTARQLAMFLALAAIWGGSYLLIKIALDGFNASMIVFARVALAAVILNFAVRARQDAGRAVEFMRTNPGRVATLGFLSVACPFLLISFGETQISSGLTGILVAPGPLFVALFAPVLDPTERVDRRGAFALLVGFAGVVVLVGADTVHDTGEFLGSLAVLGAACSYGLGALYAKNRLSAAGVPPLVVSWFSCTAAALIVLPFALVTLPKNHPDLGEIAAVVSLGVIGTALAFFLYYSLIAETGAGRASLVGYAIPPVALAYGAILLGETITVAAVVGLVLILLGVGTAGQQRTEEDQPGPPPEPA
jgi:drug/metabolite transporter (DMT)-like permease